MSKELQRIIQCPEWQRISIDTDGYNQAEEDGAEDDAPY